MINTSHYIDTISEETILKYIKEIKENDFDYFINFLKEDDFCTQYICKNTEEKAKIFLQKLINCFKLSNTNTTELYEVIKYNGSLSLKRISDWNKYEILLINEFSSEIKIQCKFAEFKYINRGI
jgi:replicative superfamily II helicase